jgi:hypothetical protein
MMMPVIPALRKLRQEDQKFVANLGYVVRPGLAQKKTKKTIGVTLIDST